MQDTATLTGQIRDKGLQIGFDLIGIAPCRVLREHLSIINNWCTEGMNAGMNYLCRNTERRTDPSSLFPGTRSVIVTGLNYYTPRLQGGNGVPVISRYAYGRDYHAVIKSKLEELLGYLKTISPGSDGKVFVDSSPVLEKAWAREAGLGWPGKHSIIINEKAGSFFFLGILLTDLNLEYDKPYSQDHCGTCRLCIESCPSGAINNNRTIDARLCIAYQTIENKDPLDETMTRYAGERVFGCDICQEVCPWNKGARTHNITDLKPDPEMLSLSADDWSGLSKDQFKRLFGNTPVGRKKYETFMKNVTNVTKYPSGDDQNLIYPL